MRLERAFLLEQLAKRTSTNVEDSDGSPSPPPTVCNTPAFEPPKLDSGPSMFNVLRFGNPAPEDSGSQGTDT